MIGFLLTSEGNQLHAGAIAIPSALQVVRVQSHTGTVDVAIGIDVRQAGIESPVVMQQSCTDVQRLLMCAIRTSRGIYTHIRQHVKLSCLHIHAGTKGSSTIGTGTYATLHLHVFQRRGKVAHIHPVHLMALSIVHRNAVSSDVDTRRICTTHTKAGIADACTRITGGDNTRSHGEQVRQILTVVSLLNLLFGDVGESHWCGLSGTGSYHLYLV